MHLDLLGIFGAGLLTFVTPCVLPLIPVYLAMLLGGAASAGEAKGWGPRLALFVNTLFFSAGLTLVFVALGLTATWLGAFLTEYRTQLVLGGGLIIFLFGLKFLGVLHIPWLEREKRLDDTKLRTRFHWLNSLVMGAVFGLGWTPCIGPILGSVLTYTASAATSPAQGALFLGAYGVGFILPLLVLSLFADSARAVLRRVSPWMPRIEKATGALLAFAGLFLIFDLGSPPEPSMAPEAEMPAKAAAAADSPAAVDPPLGAPTERPRMVEFFTPSCSICRQMIPVVGVIERDCHGRKVDVVKINVESSGGRELAQKYGVRGVPTFLFLDQKGDSAARLVGYQSLDALRQALGALVGEQCDGLGLFDPSVSPTCQGNGGSGATCDS